MTPDRSPILAKTPISGLYVNCGWGTGGFQGNAWFPVMCLPILLPGMNRTKLTPVLRWNVFRHGRLIDEAAAAAVAH